MSVIKINVVDQKLSPKESPTIASMGINEDYVEFNFDEVWDDFGKVAFFYREEDDDDVYQAIVDEEGLAPIPFEVTQEDGFIYIGVGGVKDDVIYTSEVLRYKIVKGVYADGSESQPPDPSIYEQMLTIMGNVNTKFEEVYDAYMEMTDVLDNTPYIEWDDENEFQLPLHTIDDGATTVDNTWSASKINTELNKKVAKVTGKGLSTNDFTDAEKTKLQNIESGATRTDIDSALNTASSNPVRNSAVTSRILSAESSILTLTNRLTAPFKVKEYTGTITLVSAGSGKWSGTDSLNLTDPDYTLLGIIGADISGDGERHVTASGTTVTMSVSGASQGTAAYWIRLLSVANTEVGNTKLVKLLLS